MSVEIDITYEVLLGPVHIVRVLEVGSEDEAPALVEYRHNVIDGWVRHGRNGSCRKAPVRAVLDAAPSEAEFIAQVHLRWISALTSAELRRRGTAQRNALKVALARHGMALTGDR